VLLLGAGGAARGIGFALAEARAEVIGIWNRNHERAARLAGDLEVIAQDVRVVAGERAPADIRGWDCVVNCTSVGMHGTGTEQQSACDVSTAHPGTLFVDIVYAPEETAFLRDAHEAGFRTLGGLPMLIYQGALAFELWTGVPAPVDVMFDAARQALAERTRQAATK
jgi:shikimate dehydrogenase